MDKTKEDRRKATVARHLLDNEPVLAAKKIKDSKKLAYQADKAGRQKAGKA